MDTVCGCENWDVWLYEENGNILAAMPYFLQKRGKFRYITKAPLAQNNGIILKCSDNIRVSSKQK
ncbi:MAG: methicillin resistance protein, partial [Clostridia bacterium]|nr:methicillin resistance protein [Clostridia bacterium]